MKKFAGLLAVSILGGVISLGSYKLFFEQPEQVVITESVPASRYISSSADAPTGLALDFSTAAEMTVNTVVHVRSDYAGQEPTASDPFSDFFWGFGFDNYQRKGPRSSTGSGVIISSNGYIVTNFHVVEDADKVKITLNDNRTYDAEVIGTDPTTDLALLKIDEKELPFAIFEDSDMIKIGQWVLAVGNPFNLNSTVTAGIVSAKGRNINIIDNRSAIESFIQTDAAVNPGNSGGALVDINGKLVGINTAISTRTGSFEGYSFAIPSNMVKKVVDDLIEYGVVQRAYIGVSIRDIDAKLIEDQDLEVSKGVYVAGLTEGGAAADAGIEAGDVIVQIDEVPVNKAAELQEQIGRKRPGDKVAVTVNRGGRLKQFTMVLRNKNNNTEVVTNDPTKIISVLGAQFEKAADSELRKLGISHGVQIIDLDGGKLRQAGIREGFIITKIDKTDIKEVDDILKTLDGKTGGVYIEGVYPNGMRSYYAFGI